MSAALRRAAQLAAAVSVTLAIVGLSRVPWAAVSSEDGELRLAWRYRSGRVSECRKLSEAEQAALPAHMRRTEDCQRGLRPYRLRVELGAGPDGSTHDGDVRTYALVDTIRARGAEADRPLFVFRQIRLAPGSRRVWLEFAPVGEGGPAPLRLDTVVAIRERQVVLVTYDDQAGRLVVRTEVPSR